MIVYEIKRSGGIEVVTVNRGSQGPRGQQGIPGPQGPAGPQGTTKIPIFEIDLNGHLIVSFNNLGE